jgi:ribosome biogenesis protein SSF1/2
VLPVGLVHVTKCVLQVKLRNIRRRVLLNYDVSTKMIDFWHYAIKAVPVGLSKGVKKLVQSKVPNLGRFEDVSDFITK